MTGTEYQAWAMRTMNEGLNINQQLMNAALGLCGEAGEFADQIKKAQFQGHTLNIEHLCKELGDVLWYIALAAHTIGHPIDELMEMNIEKLKLRYPEGFEPLKSTDRKEGDV